MQVQEQRRFCLAGGEGGGTGGQGRGIWRPRENLFSRVGCFGGQEWFDVYWWLDEHWWQLTMCD